MRDFQNQNQKKKSRPYRGKRSNYTRTPFNSNKAGAGRNYRPRQPPPPAKQDYGKRSDKIVIPRQEKMHWNGRTDTVWSEPQKPRQGSKTIRQEIDTEKLLRELEKGNKEALNEIAQILKEEANSTERGESKVDAFKTESTEKPDEEPKESKQEEIEDKAEAKENQPLPENQEPQKEPIEATQSSSESKVQDNILDAPELKYMNPDFWNEVEEFYDEPRLEPQKPIEPIAEEGEPTHEEGY